MENREIWQMMQELYESFASAGAMPDTLAQLGCKVQTGGRGDRTAALYMVCWFHNQAGAHWHDLCEFYTPSKPLSDSFIATNRGRASGFWRRLKPVYYEIQGLAISYKRMKDAA